VVPTSDDTIAAIATAPGRGAVAIVRMSGPRAFDIGAACVSPWPLAARRATRVTVRTAGSGTIVDHALATAFPSPHSFTGEDVVEISAHGGAVAPTRVLAALVQAGARPATPGEFTRRAVLRGKLELLQAEALGDLIDAPTSFLHDAALAQLSGTLVTRIAALRDALIELDALLSYDIDFPEEDEGPIGPARITAAAENAVTELDRLLGTLPAARIGREGAVVVFAGVPNSGKSSLFNALLGEARAIVTEHAGTTRDAIDALVDGDPYPLRLVDTAGLRDAADPIERMGVEVSTRWLARADLVLICGATGADRAVAAASVQDVAALRVCTMNDLSSADDRNADVSVSARTGDGLADLRGAIARAIVERYPKPAAGVPIILRARHESALRVARDELSEFRSVWGAGALPATVAAVHVRSAVHALDELIGAVDVEDVLARLFERFCVGK
jgi:tRNA modification GTPase